MNNRKMGSSFEDELWVNIDGYDGLYSISNLGRIMSHHWGKHRLLRQRIHPKGYAQANLSKDGGMKTFRVHRLVAKHFIDNPCGLKEINHKDEDKLNNRADNLEWCTRSYNVNYGTRKDKQRLSMIKPVVQYDKRSQVVARYDSITQASRSTGIPVSRISACCKKKRHRAGEFVWRYTKEAQDVIEQ